VKPRRPYLLRALYEWILDSEEVPNILVDAEISGVVVPTEYVQDGQIVLNISPTAVRDLSLGNEYVMCSGRFSGRNFEIVLPIESIRAIYCRDSGQGLAFEDEEFETASATTAEASTSTTAIKEDAEGSKDSSGPTLRLV